MVHDIEVKELHCFGYDGILGANALAHAYWLLDYAEGMAQVATDLGLLDTARFPVKVGFTTSKQRSPYIRGQVAGEEVRFLFDTGHNGRVQVPAGPDHYRALIPAEHRLEREGITSIGLYGQGHTRESLLFRAELRLDSLPFGERVCTTGNKGLLGNELWLDRPFLLDWNTQVIRFGAQEAAADSLDDFGFGYLFDGDTAVVVAIAKIPDMPLLIGDRILRIDDKPFTGLSEEEQCVDFIHRFGKAQREISMVIERDRVQHTLSLKKRRLL